MIYSKDKLDVLIEKYQKKADEQFQNYQETGMRRYEKAYEDAQDLADTLTMARNASDDHAQLMSLRSHVVFLATKARQIENPGEAEGLLKEILAVARLYGLIQREERL